MVKKEEDAKVWFLNITKYFQFYEYESNLKSRCSYDALIGMDWLEKHRVVIKFLEKTMSCVNEEGIT